MDKAVWAEWIIARLTDRDRAATVIGDLLESGAAEKPVWFCWSVAGVVLSLIWRGLVGLAAAYLCSSALSHGWILAQCPQARRSWFAIIQYCPLVHEPPRTWTPFFTVAVLLCIVTPYALVRYGFRNRFVQLTLALCALTTVVEFCWWVPAVVFPCAVLALIIISSSGAFVYGRRALLVLGASLVCGYAGFQFVFHLAGWYLELASPLSTLAPIIAYELLGGAFVHIVIAATACELMHRLLMRPGYK